jgi:hypothetical protein
VLHVTNGDCAAGLLRRSGIPGDVLVWPDVLHEGPIPAEHGAVWRLTRARFLHESGGGSFEHMLREYERGDAALDRYREHDELVLWFEHDLFDQLLLARHLHWLGTQGQVGTQVSLICIDRFPGVDRFAGLGQLSPSDLATLFPTRQPVTPAHVRAGADVWRAFTSGDPRALNAIVRHGVAELPFMSGALKRHLEEFPHVRDGLSRTERAVLESVASSPRDVRELFIALQDLEERIYMGDATFWNIVRRMANGAEPLVGVSGPADADEALPPVKISLAPAGQRVLAGGADAVRLRGIDRWLGGVHLTPQNVWRWDGESVRHADG